MHARAQTHTHTHTHTHICPLMHCNSDDSCCHLSQIDLQSKIKNFQNPFKYLRVGTEAILVFTTVKICIMIFNFIMCNRLCSTLLDKGQQFRNPEE
jgi:hypothetical protein